VRWAPKEIETLDYNGPSIVDAQEVWWEPLDLEAPDGGVGFDTTFDLEASAFAETGLAPSDIATARWSDVHCRSGSLSMQIQMGVAPNQLPRPKSHAWLDDCDLPRSGQAWIARRRGISRAELAISGCGCCFAATRV